MATIKQLWNANPNQRPLRVRFFDWGNGEWFNVMDTTDEQCIGWLQNGSGHSGYSDVGDWHLYTTPKAKTTYYQALIAVGNNGYIITDSVYKTMKIAESVWHTGNKVIRLLTEYPIEIEE